MTDMNHAINTLPVPPRINLREVGPRDGLQSEQPISTERKIELLEALVASGLTRIQATAFMSPRAVPALADAGEVASQLHRWPHVEWSALVANTRGAQRAVEAGIVNLEYVISAADSHSSANWRQTTEEAVAAIASIVRVARTEGGTCEVFVSTAWDCPFDGPTPPERVHRVVEAARDAGADRLCLADTIGTATPRRVVELVQSVRDRCPGLPVGLHMHNTRGVGLVGILAAMQIGVVDIDASVGGMGSSSRAPGAGGNVATEELVYLCRDIGVETGVDLTALLEAAATAQRAVGKTLPSGLLKAGERRLVA